MPDEQSTHHDKDAQGRRTRSPIHLTQRSSDAAQRASRLLDVSPPHFGMSGLTSDSDFAPPQHHAPVKRRDHRSSNTKDEESQHHPVPVISTQRSPSIPGERDSEPPPSATDDMDEWDFSEAPDSDVQSPRAGSSSQPWNASSYDKVYSREIWLFFWLESTCSILRVSFVLF